MSSQLRGSWLPERLPCPCVGAPSRDRELEIARIEDAARMGEKDAPLHASFRVTRWGAGMGHVLKLTVSPSPLWFPPPLPPVDSGIPPVVLLEAGVCLFAGT